MWEEQSISVHISRLAISLLAVILVLISGYHSSLDSYALVKQSVTKESLPVINDHSLSVQLISEGIQFPTDMAFLGMNDILVLEKNSGTVKRIVNDTMLPEPILDVNVANSKERGMLGIAVAENSDVNNSSAFVFLYFTESSTGDDDSCPPPDYYCKEGHIYHFDLSQNRTQLKLGGMLSDKIANNMDELKGVLFARGFGGISDIELGPDGYIYVLSYEKNIINKGYGSVYRIVPELDEENR